MLTPYLPLRTSRTMALHSQAASLRAHGKKIHNLCAGEPLLPVHPSIQEAVKKGLSGTVQYGPSAGLPELREAFAQWMNVQADTKYTRENVAVTPGGKFGLYALCQNYMRPGDEALVIAPYWVSYPDITSMCGGVPVIVSTSEEGGWKVTSALLEAACTPNTKFLFLNNANNPTGTLYTRQELAGILAVAVRYNLFVISDEVYSGLVYGDQVFVSCASFPEHRDRVAIIQSCSKHFAMTGWRVGFVVAAPEIISTIQAFQSNTITCVSAPDQWAALAALRSASEIQPWVRDEMRIRRDALVLGLRETFDVSVSLPPSALYVFIPQSIITQEHVPSEELCRSLLDFAHVAAIPGSAFGTEGMLRLSFGAPAHELKEAVGALKKFPERTPVDNRKK